MLYMRSDIDGWSRIDLWKLSDAIEIVRSRYGSGAVIQPNELANLAILSPYGENRDRTPSPNGIGMFYAGYIDMARGDVVWEEDGVNNPLRNVEIVTIDGGRSIDVLQEVH